MSEISSTIDNSINNPEIQNSENLITPKEETKPLNETNKQIEVSKQNEINSLPASSTPSTTAPQINKTENNQTSSIASIDSKMQTASIGSIPSIPSTQVINNTPTASFTASSTPASNTVINSNSSSTDHHHHQQQQQQPQLSSKLGNLSHSKFNFGVTLGTGSFGRVRFATHIDTNTYWAIKILKKAEIIRLQQIEHMLSEKNILISLSHPFIVNLAGTFQDTKYLYMVLEYVIGGEFFTHLRRAGRFDNNTAKFYASQVILIFDYLHKKDYIYRDLKPENLLLDSTGYIKITDFGFAKHVTFKTYTLCGTPEYIAPEVLLNKGHGKGVDWWTLGILLYEMLAGQPPFTDDDPMGIYQQILSGKLNFPRFFDRNGKQLIKKLLTSDLTKRYGCLKNGAEDIKSHKYFSGTDWDNLIYKKTPPPILPKIHNASDTSNFDPYPDSIEEATVPIYNGKDPFIEF